MLALKGKELYAYVAGIIDGEGHIYLNRQKPNSSVYRVQLDVTNTNEWLPQFLKLQFGGNIALVNRNSQRRSCWRWIITCRKAISVLEYCLPYLQLKEHQARLAIAFSKRRRKGRFKDRERLFALDEADKILMTSYNKRGD